MIFKSVTMVVGPPKVGKTQVVQGLQEKAGVICFHSQRNPAGHWSLPMTHDTSQTEIYFEVLRSDQEEFYKFRKKHDIKVDNHICISKSGDSFSPTEFD